MITKRATGIILNPTVDRVLRRRWAIMVIALHQTASPITVFGHRIRDSEKKNRSAVTGPGAFFRAGNLTCST